MTKYIAFIARVIATYISVDVYRLDRLSFTLLKSIMTQSNSSPFDSNVLEDSRLKPEYLLWFPGIIQVFLPALFHQHRLEQGLGDLDGLPESPNLSGRGNG